MVVPEIVRVLRSCSSVKDVRIELKKLVVSFDDCSKDKLLLQGLLTNPDDKLCDKLQDLLRKIFIQRLEKLEKWSDEESEKYIDPISQDIIRDPVILKSTKKSYDRKYIELWLKENNRCPMTNLKLDDKTYITNDYLKSLIENYFEKLQMRVKYIANLYMDLRKVVKFRNEETIVQKIKEKLLLCYDYSNGSFEVLKLIDLFLETVKEYESLKEFRGRLMKILLEKGKITDVIPLMESLIALSSDNKDKRGLIERVLKLYQKTEVVSVKKFVYNLVKWSSFFEPKRSMKILMKYHVQYPEDLSLLFRMIELPYSPLLHSTFYYKIGNVLMKNNRFCDSFVMFENSICEYKDNLFAKKRILELLVKNKLKKDHLAYEICVSVSKWYKSAKRKKKMLYRALKMNPKNKNVKDKLCSMELEENNIGNLINLQEKEKVAEQSLIFSVMLKQKRELDNFRDIFSQFLERKKKDKILRKNGCDNLHEFEDIFKSQIKNERLIVDKSDSVPLIADILEVYSCKIVEFDGYDLSSGIYFLSECFHKNLEVLVLQNCNISDDGISFLLRRKMNLKLINLKNSQFEDKGIRILCECLRSFDHLECINVEGNSFGGNWDRIKSLGEVIQEVGTLKRLVLKDNGIVFDQAMFLVELVNCRRGFEVLDLRKNFFSDEEIGILSKAARKFYLKLK